ncbi:PQQ-binding-like beta-propeller repeat protein [Limnoglobus roseus]|uniref:Alcohol dehydrogenase n=1 Tax=Limnoglobus roseus TaxID=2598579 RepID=A0A5C1AQ19_9BACT|nr:PQQ-binding-like beta-propeller repeat protein [Limnoglobus roseus]QEL20116.1 alcohol dehydrogenase [Limnoglobus roseus]
MNARKHFFALLCTLSTTAAFAEDWPQWRGSGRDNKVVGFTIPAAWPKDFKQQWKVAVGEGLASPALVGDNIFTFTRQGNDEVIRCLSAATGKEVWQDKYAAPSVTGPAGDFKGPRSSPAVADGKVCTHGVGGTVSCIDVATGKVAWRKETKGKPRFYTASSPAVIDGLCIAHVGTDGRGELTAYDLKTGDAKWTWTGDGPSYGSPVLMTLDKMNHVVVLTEKNLIGVNLSDGKLLWKTPLTTGRYQTNTPAIDGNTVICAGYAFTIEKKGEAYEAKQLWKGQAPHNYNSPVLKDGLLYGYLGMGRGSSKLFCQDAKTGKLVWEDTTNRGECGFVLDTGMYLVALSSDSNMIVFKPGEKELNEVAKYKLADSPIWSEPILTGNRIFVKDRNSLILWTIE